jgi:hypothetical protein
MKDKVCCECGHVGKPIPQEKSSFMVDMVIWCYFAFLTAMSQQLYLVLIPLAWTIYHCARFNSVACPQCKSLEMVPMNSRKGQYVLAHPNPIKVTHFSH